MKHSFLTALLLAIATLMQAQDAREVLDKTADAIRRGGPSLIEFSATAFEGSDAGEAMTGTMAIDGKKYHLQSNGITIWYDGQTQWSYIHDSEEVNMTNPTEGETQMVNPYAFLNIYKEGYRLSIKKKTLRGFDTYEVRLRARSKDQDVSEIYVDVKRDDFTPLCIRARQDNNWSRISIKSIKGGQHFASDRFTYNAAQHPDLEVIDLR